MTKNWEKWPSKLKRQVERRFDRGEMIKNIAADLGLNYSSVGEYLRIGLGKDTRSGGRPRFVPTPQRELREQHYRDMRNKR